MFVIRCEMYMTYFVIGKCELFELSVENLQQCFEVIHLKNVYKLLIWISDQKNKEMTRSLKV